MGLGNMLSGAFGHFLKPKLGCFGNVVFEASSLKLLTFNDYRRTTKIRYAKHEIINGDTLIEKTGFAPMRIKITIPLNSNAQTDPLQELFPTSNPLGKIATKIGDKFLKKFLGLDGNDPASVAEKFRVMCYKAEPSYLVLGNKIIGSSKWIIEDVEEKIIHWDNSAQALVMNLDVSFIEFPEVPDNDS